MSLLDPLDTDESMQMEEMQIKILDNNQIDNGETVLHNDNLLLNGNEDVATTATTTTTDMELYELFETLNDGDAAQEDAEVVHMQFDDFGAEVEIEDHIMADNQDNEQKEVKQEEQQDYQMLEEEPVMFYIADTSTQGRLKFPSVQLTPPKLKDPEVHPLKPFPFIFKLYLVANSEYVNYINWSTDGLEIELVYLELQYHLTSSENIFQSGSIVQFNNQLLGHGFERVPSRENTVPEDPLYIVLIYKHQHFVRGKPEKLQWIAEKIFVEIEENLPVLVTARPLATPSAAHVTRMTKRGDLCCKFLCTRSALQMARGKFYTTLRHNIDLQLLKDRGSSLEVLAELVPRRGRGAVISKPSNSVTTLPNLESIKYVKPHESAFDIPPGQQTVYAGYFGNLDVAVVKNFFAEYLPRYGQSRTDIILDATTKTSNFHQNLPIGVNYSDDDDDEDTLPSGSAKGKRSNGNGASQDIKIQAIDGCIEEFMAEICGDVGLATENDKSNVKSTPAEAPRTKSTVTSKPKVRKKRKLLEVSSTDEDEDEEEEVVSKTEKVSQPKDIKTIKDDEDDKMEGEGGKVPSSNAEIAKSPEGEEKPKSNTGNDDTDEDEDFDDDDDYIDKNVEYRTTTQLSETPRRYDLRNTKRPTKRYLT